MADESSEIDRFAADLDSLAADLRTADTAFAFTGAGVSTASGIPPFRGEGGIWETEFDPRDFRIGRFEADPAGFWRDRLALHEAMFPESVGPNPAHAALVELESAGVLDAVVTQNTDGLHAEAGSRRVLELHGTTSRVVCRRCGDRQRADPVHDRVRDGEVPPTCDCGGLLKPDVVLFGEQLPRETYAEARDLAGSADVVLAVGSSLQVEPAASIPRDAARGGTLAVVNFDPTPLDDRADYVFRADVTDLLPALARRLAG
ncbi:NAD-dependent protein deacylase [Salinirubrum litoreum]|uniref:NAD-dependent protein deacylase n=1 Tax=Salinirubrum litoreum TaxID=1126234 RepID=A0ABD5R7J3_9EURY